MKKYFLVAVSFLLGFFSIKNTFAVNEMVTFMDNISTQWLATTSDIMATPIWQILYFVIGMVVIVTVIWVFLSVFWFFKKT